MTDPQAILDFWLEELEPKDWYVARDEVDDAIRDRFLETWEKGAAGELAEWATCPTKSLALIILLDQFPRNMFRGSGKSFASDRRALCCAKKAIERGFDMRTEEPQRQFYYMPLMHSESLTDQERCIRLMGTRMAPTTGPSSNLFHAKAHREVIRQFGRFPYRNEALERSSNEQELAYLSAGGYAHTIRELSA